MKRVLITGVSSGTGLGLTEQLVKNGYQVIGSVRTQKAAEALQSQFGDSVIPLVFDITNTNEIQKASQNLKQHLGDGSLAAIINNAGSARIGPLLHIPIDELRHHLEVLVVGQLAVIQHFYKFLLPETTDVETGKIINISSVSGVGTNYLFGCYVTGKHALEGLSKTLRQECEMHGIKTVVVAPGNIATAIWDKQTEDMIEHYKNTEYYYYLKKIIEDIRANIPGTAMSIEEFSEAFYRIFKLKNPLHRYTVVKTRNKRIPFSKPKVRIFKY